MVSEKNHSLICLVGALTCFFIWLGFIYLFGVLSGVAIFFLVPVLLFALNLWYYKSKGKFSSKLFTLQEFMMAIAFVFLLISFVVISSLV